MGRKLTIEEFIEKAKQMHGDKYDYSKSIYLSRLSGIKIICPKHGEFEQIVDTHLKGKGCKQCGIEDRTKLITSSSEIFINKSFKIHGDKYDYSLVDYKNNYTKIKIICQKHGVFEQNPSTHLNGYGCKICSGNKKKTTEEFILQAKNVHGDVYDYSLTEYSNTKGLVKIICPVHGIFEQRADLHIKNRGCPICSESKGEKEIRKLLTNIKIEFSAQEKFNDCKRLNSLMFDFYLPDYNVCIEYNGEQHYRPIEHFGGKKYFKLIKERDAIKQKFCLTNNIKLFVIKFNDDISNSLTNILNELRKHNPYPQQNLNS